MKVEHYWPGALSAGEVHLWHLAINQNLQQLLKKADCLSAREKEKANRFKFEKDRVHYIARHVFLRKVLGCYLNIACEQIKISENDYGKPFVDDSVNFQSLQFSLSKSHNHVLLAITRKRLIGCDIEKRNESLDYGAVIDNFFSSREIEFILNSSNQRTSFFDYWTAKEAYIKARGEGLSLALDQFTLHVDKNENITMLENLVYPGDVDRWRTGFIRLSDDFSAAITIEGKVPSIRQVNVIY